MLFIVGASSILMATHPYNVDEGHNIIFAGAGGHPNANDAVSLQYKTKRKIKDKNINLIDNYKLPTSDQRLSHGNLGLLISFLRKTPLRVLKLIGNKRFDYYHFFTIITGQYNDYIILDIQVNSFSIMEVILW